VRDEAQEVADDVEASAPLVVGLHDVPWRPRRVAGLEHVVARARVVVPAAVGLQVHRRQLPGLAPIVDAILEPARLLLHADLEPVLDEEDAGFDERLLEPRDQLEELESFLFAAVPQDSLVSGAVVPAAVEDHDLAARRQMANVALHVDLALFALRRRRQRDDAEHARADAFGDRLDRAALPCAVAPFEHDANLRALVLDPLLDADELLMQLPQLLLVVLARHLFLGLGPAVGAFARLVVLGLVAAFLAHLVTAIDLRNCATL